MRQRYREIASQLSGARRKAAVNRGLREFAKLTECWQRSSTIAITGGTAAKLTITGIIKDDTLYVQAAAGVVADSVPEMEWRETEHKARALLRASELVEEGLE